MWLILVSVLCFLVLLLSVYDIWKPKNYPPGPPWIPIVGSLKHYYNRLSVIGYHHLVCCELTQKYGSIVGLKMGRDLVVAVSGPEAVKEILTREEFDGRPDGYFFRLRTFGKRLGIVFVDGPLWQKQRKFSMQHLKNFGFGRKEMEHQIEEETRELVESLRKRCVEPIYMNEVFDVSVLNSLWAMMAGKRFALDDCRLIKLLQIIHDAFRLTDMSGGILNQLPILRYIAPNFTKYNDIMNVINRMKEFLEETVDEHKKSICPNHARDLIDAFLQNMNMKKDETFTNEQLLSLCLDMFMAGAETTSNTLGYAMLYMLLYPDKQAKVQKELDEVVGRNRWPKLEDRIRLPYTEAVMNEVQRHANIPPFGIAHRAVKDTELMGFTIPKGTTILTSIYSIHMDKDFWGDPEDFRPERFYENEEKAFVPEKYFAPFGYGKRRCLGESMAKVNYFVMFSCIMHTFKIEAVPTDKKPTLEGVDGVTVQPKPYRAYLKPRHD